MINRLENNQTEPVPGVAVDRIAASAWLLLATEPDERGALDLEPGVQAEWSEAELQRARERTNQYARKSR
jgi:hypothetical protein